MCNNVDEALNISPEFFEDSNMNSKHIENGLALVGALIILIGVSMAAGSAFAATPDLDNARPARISTSIVEAG